MIFHVYHFHNELTCPINDTDLFLSSFGSVVDSLEANNVEVSESCVRLCHAAKHGDMRQGREEEAGRGKGMW